MTTALMALIGGVVIAIAFIGCVVPALPGPLLAYAVLFLPYCFGRSPETWHLVAGGITVLVATIVDYVLPAIFAKTFHCSKMGLLGCALGTIVGLFFLPLGIVVGPFLGTIIGELIAGKGFWASMKGGVGAFCGFVASLIAKFFAVALIAFWFVCAVLKSS